MLCAAIGDIHANLPALDAVLEAIDDAGIHTIVNTGDCVVGGAWPNEVIAVLRARSIPSVQGDWDRYTARFHRQRKTLEKTLRTEDLAAIEWTYEATTSDGLEYLAGLPKERTLTVDGIVIHLCHEGRQNATESVEDAQVLARFRRLREATQAHVIVCGHARVPSMRWVDDTLVVNPGGVGNCEKLGQVARFAIIDTEQDPWTAHFHEIPY